MYRHKNLKKCDFKFDEKYIKTIIVRIVKQLWNEKQMRQQQQQQ
jgi:hypothetical protein